VRGFGAPDSSSERPARTWLHARNKVTGSARRSPVSCIIRPQPGIQQSPSPILRFHSRPVRYGLLSFDPIRCGREGVGRRDRLLIDEDRGGPGGAATEAATEEGLGSSVEQGGRTCSPARITKRTHFARIQPSALSALQFGIGAAAVIIMYLTNPFGRPFGPKGQSVQNGSGRPNKTRPRPKRRQ
jgi:hypothetical protein